MNLSRFFLACYFLVSISLIQLGLVAKPQITSLLAPSGFTSKTEHVVQTGSLSDTLHFAVIGDYGSGSSNEAAVANLVKSWNPDFIITVGDNNYPSGAALTIDTNIGQFYHQFIHPYQGSYNLEVRVPPPLTALDSYTYQVFLPIIWTTNITPNQFFPSLGNHDWLTTGARPYLDYFSLPGNERYYDFVRGPVHFFALDSDPHEPDGITSSSTQALWLQNKLLASTSCWQLVYFHHAPYSSSLHGSNSSMQWPFQSWGADAVLAGHDHTYERLDIGGMPYFVNGLGGNTLYAFQPTPLAGSQVRYNDNFGAMWVTVSQESITYEFIAVDGTVVDNYSQTGGCM